MIIEVETAMYEKHENSNKEIENIGKNQIEMIELKNTIPKLKNSMEGFNVRMYQSEKEKVIKLEARRVEFIQLEKQKEKSLRVNITRINVDITGVPESAM